MWCQKGRRENVLTVCWRLTLNSWWVCVSSSGFRATVFISRPHLPQPLTVSFGQFTPRCQRTSSDMDYIRPLPLLLGKLEAWTEEMLKLESKKIDKAGKWRETLSKRYFFAYVFVFIKSTHTYSIYPIIIPNNKQSYLLSLFELDYNLSQDKLTGQWLQLHIYHPGIFSSKSWWKVKERVDKWWMEVTKM